MALPQGLYFRAINNQVSPTDYEAEIGTTANYPHTTAKGIVVGWENVPTGTRDRTAVGDVRTRGIHFGAQTGVYDYRIDLPAAGTYNIRAAFGDKDNAHHQRVRILDGTTVLFDYSSAGVVGIDAYMDATGVTRTSASDWVTNNAIQVVTLTTTTLRIRMGGGVTTTDPNWSIVALYVESAGGTTYSYTASGGFLFSGTSLPIRSLVRAATGGVLFSGASSVSFTSAVQSLIVVAAGGINFSGIATKLRGVVKTTSGGIIFGGSSATVLTPDPNPTASRAFKRGRRPRTRKNY